MEKYWESLLDFQQKNLLKLEKVHAFQKRNETNELIEHILFKKKKKKNRF